MSDNVIEIVETEPTTPFIHKFGKYMFAAVVVFGTGLLAERLYDAALEAYRNRQYVPEEG
jgi:hypothetical protein